MKKVFVFLVVTVLLSGIAYRAGNTDASARAVGASPVPEPRKASGKVAVFNVAKVMKEYRRWDYFAGIMNKKRAAATEKLVKLRSDGIDITEEEKQVRKELDDESSIYLAKLYAEVEGTIKSIAEANEFDIVFSYPDATTVEETKSTMYYDLKMRPSAAMPIYVAGSADITATLITTLNKKYPPPSPNPDPE
jgi:Skp family chaperone for outer membrane proteins